MAAAVETEPAFIERCGAWINRCLGDSGAWRCRAADAGDALVGTIWLQLIEKLPNPVAEPEYHGYVSSLYVRPQYRRAGLGSGLLAACLRECEARAVDAVILWPTPQSRSLSLPRLRGPRRLGRATSVDPAAEPREVGRSRIEVYRRDGALGWNQE